MPITGLTRAQQLVAQYQEPETIGLPPNPSLNPAWNDRARVPSPPRRDGAVDQISADGVDDLGRTTYNVTEVRLGSPDRGGSTPPKPEEYGADAFLQSCSEDLFVPKAVKLSPTYMNHGRPEGSTPSTESDQATVDQEALVAAAQISRLLEKSPDEALKIFRMVISHPVTGLVTYGHLTEAVQSDLSRVFFLIITRKPWLFQVCRLLLSLNGNSSLPKTFRACCSLATQHAFLAYADIVSPYGKLEDLAHKAEVQEDEAQVRQLDEDLRKHFVEANKESAAEKALDFDPTAVDTLTAVDALATDVDEDDEEEGDTFLDGDEDEDEVTEGGELEQLERVEGATSATEDSEFLSPDELAALTDDELDELTRPEPNPDDKTGASG